MIWLSFVSGGLDFREEYLKVAVLQSFIECPNNIAQTLWLRSDKLNVISVLPNIQLCVMKKL
ncbi:hypothetical protein ACJMK2_007434 [Sinanodonta woodiana]|uniref:Uncharacterized protein n=1 Tax=Sinanodonta woodiana TaxID=1069815 RepID=A0ABD3VIJ1_SINWO